MLQMSGFEGLVDEARLLFETPESMYLSERYVGISELVELLRDEGFSYGKVDLI